MMAGNPNWWSMNDMHPHESHHQHEFVYASSDSNSSLSSSSIDTAAVDHHHATPDFPAVRSWSQLLMGGLGTVGENQEEEKFGGSPFQQQKKPEMNWEEQVLNLNPFSNFTRQLPLVDVKQEALAQSTSQLYLHHNHSNNHDQYRSNSNWPVSSPPNSCITNLSNSFLNFSGGKPAAAAEEGKNHHHHHQNQDHSSECNSTSSGGATKKPRVQQSSAQPALKVRKEKLGDRITALHQLVSPFGKTDTASVLSEAIGYIRFLQGQIEALSSPYMRNGSGSTVHHQHSVQERNCLYPEEGAGQFLNNDLMGMDGRGASKQDYSQSRVGLKDLRSRGLCLVPISCTQNVGNDTGADYWAPAALGGGF